MEKGDVAHRCAPFRTDWIRSPLIGGFPLVSYLPDGSMRRSLKQRRDEQPATRRRNAVLGVVAVVVVVAAVAWGLFAQMSSSAGAGGWHQVRTDQKATVATRIASVFHILPKAAPASPTPSPTPAATPTPPKKNAAAVAAAAAAAASNAAAAAVQAKRLRKAALLAAIKSGHNPRTVALAANGTTIDTATNRVVNTVTPAPLAAPTVAPTVAPTAAPAEVFAPQVVVDARFVRQVQPEYPDLAREQNLSGTAVVLVTVGPKGNVLSTRIEKSAGGTLDIAALSAARQSTFQPPKIDGKPATETYRIVYSFSP